MSDADRDSDGPGSAGAGSRAASDPHAAAPVGSAPDTPSGIDIQAYIGKQLRAVYQDVADQPVPDRFLELMRKLDAK